VKQNNTPIWAMVNIEGSIWTASQDNVIRIWKESKVQICPLLILILVYKLVAPVRSFVVTIKSGLRWKEGTLKIEDTGIDIGKVELGCYI
jgi:hypothetical protein